jgi:aminoglycoside phosphotransferase (APT) family kinase protein
VAVEQGWGRRFEFVPLSLEDASVLIGEPLLDIQPLSGGARNTNYRLLRVAQPEPVVLRLHTGDPTACLREQRLLELVKDSVPVPHVLRAEAAADPPWSLQTFVPGERFDHALSGASSAAVDRMAHSAGVALAHIHRFTFPRAGFLDPDLQLADPLGPQYAWHNMLQATLDGDRVRRHLGPELAGRLERFVSDNTQLENQMSFGGPCLSHSDYKPWNMLVRDGQLAAVLDWEFAFAGAPLNDVGNFLRYSARQQPAYESGFVNGYRAAGGQLPDDWKRLSRMVDLINLSDFLNRAESDSPIVTDVRPLVQRTLDDYG